MSKSRSGRRSFHPANSPPGGGGGVSTPQTARFFLKKNPAGPGTVTAAAVGF
jgi:hypothetical protein